MGDLAVSILSARYPGYKQTGAPIQSRPIPSGKLAGLDISAGACADESVPYRVGALVSVLNTMHDEEKVFVDPYPLVASAEELSGTVRMV